MRPALRFSPAASLLVVATTSLLACCSDCDGGTEPAPNPGGFSIAVSPGSASLKAGESTSASITATRTGKFTGAIALRVDGAPTGVSATPSPGSCAAGVTAASLGITVGSSVVPGTYSLTLVGSASGQADRTATFTLTVTDPGRFTIGLNPTALSVQQGRTGTVAITIARTAPFADAVGLVVDGAPAGVTATLTPPTIAAGATTASLAVVVAAGAAPGNYTLTVRGTGTGVTAQSAPLTLTITPDPGSFTLALNPVADSIKQGQRDSLTVTIARVAPFAGAVTMAVTGAPAGVSTSFSPAAIGAGATASVLTLDVAAGAAPGVYQLSVQGSAAGLPTQSVTFALTITPDPGSFTLALNPVADTVQQGRRDSVVVSIARVAPFTGAVALTVTGAPPGVTASFNPAAIAAGSTTGKLILDVGTTAAVGTYQLTVQATAPGLPVQTALLSFTVKPCFTIALSTDAVTAAQGQSGNVTVTLTRVAPFTGAVSLTLNNIPAWGNWHFNPSTIPAGSTTSTLTVGAGANTVPGTYTLTVRASAAGCPDATATLTFTVTSVGGITVNTTPVSVRRGQVGTSPIAITRTAPFAGVVVLTAEGLPAGVTASFNPSSLAPGQTTSQLTFSVLATTTAGAYPVTVRAAGTGVPAGTATQQLNVTDPPPGNVTMQFCSPQMQPVWLGYQDGTEQWTQVAGSAGSYNFPIAAAKGGLAFVLQAGSGYEVVLLLATREELIEAGSQSCSFSPPSKVLTGTVAGLGPNDEMVAAVGDGWGEILIGGGTSYTIPNAGLGTRDLFAARVSYVNPQPLPSIILRRNTNYPAGSAIPLLDFNSGEAFAPTTQTVTVGNAGSDVLVLEESYLTTNGTVGYIPVRVIPATGTYMVIPPASAQPNEVYGLRIDARPYFSAPTSRVVTGSFTSTTAQSFTLGPSLAPPSVFVLSPAPLYQVQLRVTLPAEYNRAVYAELEQATRNARLYATIGWVGGQAVDITTPDLRTVPGWQTTWGPLAGVQTRRTLTGYGWTGATSTLFPGLFGSLYAFTIGGPGVVVRHGSLYDQVVSPATGGTR